MQKKTIVTYLVFAFVLAWVLMELLLLCWGGLSSPTASIVLPIIMYAPTAAVLITKLLNRGTHILGASFKPKFRGHIRWYLLAWLLPLALVFFGEFLSFGFFPDSFDVGMGALHSTLASANPGTIVTDSAVYSTFFFSILLLITINVIPTMLYTFGEEVGWRGFLFPAVRSRTTEVKANIICGIIWGLWHAPVIAAGYNFGTGYWGFPWIGILGMCVLATSMGIFLSFVTRKSGSIWPAVLAHGAINSASGKLYAVFLREDYSASANTTFVSYIIQYIIPFLLLGVAMLIVFTRKKKGKEHVAAAK